MISLPSGCCQRYLRHLRYQCAEEEGRHHLRSERSFGLLRQNTGSIEKSTSHLVSSFEGKRTVSSVCLNYFSYFRIHEKNPARIIVQLDSILVSNAQSWCVMIPRYNLFVALNISNLFYFISSTFHATAMNSWLSDNIDSPGQSDPTIASSNMWKTLASRLFSIGRFVWLRIDDKSNRYEIKYSPIKYIETTERGLVVITVNEADGGRYDCYLGGSLLCSYSITVDAHRYLLSPFMHETYGQLPNGDAQKQAAAAKKHIAHEMDKFIVHVCCRLLVRSLIWSLHCAIFVLTVVGNDFYVCTYGTFML